MLYGAKFVICTSLYCDVGTIRYINKLPLIIICRTTTPIYPQSVSHEQGIREEIPCTPRTPAQEQVQINLFLNLNLTAAGGCLPGNNKSWYTVETHSRPSDIGNPTWDLFMAQVLTGLLPLYLTCTYVLLFILVRGDRVAQFLLNTKDNKRVPAPRAPAPRWPHY